MDQQLAELKRSYDEYVNFRNRVNSYINVLATLGTPLGNASKALKASYTYDDVSADNGLLDSLIVNANTVLSNLRGKVLPEINQKIYSLERKVEEAKNQQISAI